MKSTQAKNVRELIATFSTLERQMLILHWAEEMKPVEIELIFGLDEGSVCKMLHDIKQRMQKALRHCPPAPGCPEAEAA